MPKFTVCPACEGEGYVGTLGAMTGSEFAEWYGDDVESYREAHESSKVPCACCKGLRVVTEEVLSDWDDLREYEAERAAEQRAGC